jgi:2,3-bisphosphoglycerate-dependent phosphoglycerate mutase
MFRHKNRFLLARHGESIWNHDSKFTGWTDIPLTYVGREEAKRMSNTIKNNNLYPNIFFASVLNRTIETSNIIRNDLNNSSIPIHTSWRLNEKHYGTLEGVPRQYLREKYGDLYTKKMRSNFYMKPPVLDNYEYKNEYNVYRNCYFKQIKNGESKEDVLNRLIPYFENDILYTLSENKFPLIITHKHTARVLMKHLLKINDDEFENYEIPSKKMLLINLDNNLVYENHEELSY